MKIRALVAAAICAPLLATAATAPAHADDKRACVSWQEFKQYPDLTYPQVEALWEVQNRRSGHPFNTVNPHLISRVYKACGYDARDEIFVVGVYRKTSKRAMFYVRVRLTDGLPPAEAPIRYAAR